MPTVDFTGAQIEAIKGQLDTDKPSLKVRDARLQALEVHQGDPPWTGDGGPGALDFLSQYRGSPGFVENPAVARSDVPCLCYEIQKRGGGEGELCFKHGVVGALDPEQIGAFCEVKTTREPTPEQRLRLEAFQDSAETCKVEVAEVPEGEKIEPFLGCMSRELTKRNRTLSGGALLEPDSSPMPEVASEAVGGGAGQGGPPPPLTDDLPAISDAEGWQRRSAEINAQVAAQAMPSPPDGQEERRRWTRRGAASIPPDSMMPDVVSSQLPIETDEERTERENAQIREYAPLPGDTPLGDVGGGDPPHQFGDPEDLAVYASGIMPPAGYPVRSAYVPLGGWPPGLSPDERRAQAADAIGNGDTD